jgi:hypothetical protein
MSFEAPEEKFSANETINGIEVSCRWVNELNSYALSIPKSMFVISDDLEKAKKMFEWVIKEAKNVKDESELYKKVEWYKEMLVLYGEELK